MIYKAMFDTRTPTWQAYGRAVFFETESLDPEEHSKLAVAEAQKDYPGATILVVAIGASTRAAWDAFREMKQRHADWVKRTAQGIPNRREDLEVSKEKPIDPADAFGLLRSFLAHRAYLAEAHGLLGAELERRACVHDLSKLKDDEFAGFCRINAAARVQKFGSPEYQAGIDAERAVVDLHYLRNSHHPERPKLAGQAAEAARWLPDDATYWEAHQAARLTFLDIIEMACDWYAAWKGWSRRRPWLESAALNLDKKGEHLSAEQRWLAEEVIAFLAEAK